jgi:hypothetical protein
MRAPEWRKKQTFSKIFFDGANGANGPFYRWGENRFTGRMAAKDESGRMKADPAVAGENAHGSALEMGTKDVNGPFALWEKKRRPANFPDLEPYSAKAACGIGVS